MKFLENIRIALRSIQSNILRSILTLMIVAFGILALVGILTVIDVMLYSMQDSFSGMGANTFSIERKSTTFKTNTGRRVYKTAPAIDYREATQFRESYSFPADITVYMFCKSDVVAKFKNEKTNPRNDLIAVDDQYLRVKDKVLSHGRYFSVAEVEYGRSLCVLGQKVADKLFDGSPEKALEKTIWIDNRRYTVIGVLDKQGSSLSSENDRVILIPLVTGKNLYASPRQNYDLEVAISHSFSMDEAISAAIGEFRNIRSLRTIEENNFEITKSDSMLGMIKEGTQDLRWAAYFIGGITLLGAAIGLMNIMLVSVTERTREIGIRKSLGASSRNVLVQFLTEGIVICQLGGVLGIVLSLLAGYWITAAMGGSFVVPWKWIGLGISVCMIVGLVSALYPAMKAARLDPIESLRYE